MQHGVRTSADNGGNLDVIDQTWADDMNWHGASQGRKAFKVFFTGSGAGAFADMHLEIHEVIAAGDDGVVRFTKSGTNVGEFMGNATTGKHAEWLGIGIDTVRDDRITSGWFAEDILGVLIQLDAINVAV